MRELFQVFGIVAVLFACVAFGIQVSVSNECETYEHITSRETNINGMTCYVKHNEQWFTRDEFKALITANGELIHE